MVRDAASLLDISHLATKDDLRLGLAEMKAEILKWVFGMILGSTLINVGTMIALVKLLGH